MGYRDVRDDLGERRVDPLRFRPRPGEGKRLTVRRRKKKEEIDQRTHHCVGMPGDPQYYAGIPAVVPCSSVDSSIHP